MKHKFKDTSILLNIDSSIIQSNPDHDLWSSTRHNTQGCKRLASSTGTNRTFCCCIPYTLAHLCSLWAIDIDYSNGNRFFEILFLQHFLDDRPPSNQLHPSHMSFWRESWMKVSLLLARQIETRWYHWILKYVYRSYFHLYRYQSCANYQSDFDTEQST